MSKILKLEDFKANTKEWFLEQLGNMSAPQALRTISDLYDELHKPTYPKTYEECCKILGLKGEMPTTNMWYKMGLILDFYELIICRDAYWEIAGEQMRLGKPWKPDFTNNNEKRYSITTENKVKKDFCGVGAVNTILTFPTIEMRNAFYGNFKDLIENCKELL